MQNRAWGILLGAILIIVGVGFLLKNFGIVVPLMVIKLWPVLLIVVGIKCFIAKKQGKSEEKK